MRTVVATSSVMLGVALSAACAGDTPRYRLGPTYSCLSEKGIAVSDPSSDSDFFVFDPIARAARGGALHAVLPNNSAVLTSNSVLVVFERSEDDARKAEAAYEDAAPVFPDPSRLENKNVERVRNAVVLWMRPPTDRETAELGECLRE
jgi:hypothetical protein